MTNARYKKAVLVCALAIAVGAGLLQWGLGGDGATEWPDFAFFVGRLHPLVVHLPIGVLILVAVLELSALIPSFGRPIARTLDLVQPLLLASCFGAFLVGQLLGLEGGFSAAKLEEHRELAFITVLFSCVQVVAWSQASGSESASRRRQVYRVVLALNLVALSAAAHLGGTLSRGDAYLSRYAPSWAKPLLGGAEESLASATEPVAVEAGEDALLYEHAVKPMLRKYCLECHGAQKTKGGLRVDSLSVLLAGGDSGPSVLEGVPDGSPLVTRSELAHDHEDTMPPEGEPRPSAAQVALLRFWVARGMSEELTLRDVLLPEAARAAVEQALAREAVPPKEGSEDSAPASGTVGEPVDGERGSGEAVEGGSDSVGSGQGADGAEEPSTPSPEKVRLSPFELLQEKCVDCHGPTKQKARLRVDSLAGILSGGREGPGIVSGAPSEGTMIGAIRLPLTSKGHMPPKSRPQFTASERQRVEAWLRAQARGRVGGVVASPDVVQGSAIEADSEEEGQGTEAPGMLDWRSLCAEPQEPPPGQSLLFDELVLPLLNAKCTSCHDQDLASGGLNLASCQSILEGGDAGASVVPERPEESLLIQRLALEVEHDEHMPPVDYPQLSPEQQLLLEQWVEGGARRDILVATSTSPGGEKAKQASAQSEMPSNVQPQSGRGGGLCSLNVPKRSQEDVLFVFFFVLGVLTLRRRRVEAS